MKKSQKIVALALGLGLIIFAIIYMSYTSGSITSSDYNKKTPVTLLEGGDINDIPFNLYSLEKGDKGNDAEVNLIVYEHYTEEDVAKFINAYIQSLVELGNNNVRINLYHLTASNLDIINDDSLLKGEESPAMLLYVYDNGKLYSQYDEAKVVTDINNKYDEEVKNPTGETEDLESIGSEIPLEKSDTSHK